MGINRIHRRDGNHAELIKGLEKIGASVQSLSQVGRGCPDLLVGWKGANILLEVKDGKLIPSKRKLTIAEEEWHQQWRGQVATVGSLEDALKTIGVTSRAETQWER
jgi:hypothetical protein